MCGIVGFTNYNGNMNFEEADKIINNMNENYLEEDLMKREYLQKKR